MNEVYNYEEYLKLKSKNTEEQIQEAASFLIEHEYLEEILFDALYEYETKITDEIKSLYQSINIDIAENQLESYFYIINDTNIKNKISDLVFELNNLRTAISNLTEEPNVERKHKSLDDILNSTDINQKENILKTIKYYETLYNDKIKYIGAGQSCTVFSIGNKVIKFGSMRHYSEIPYCLNIEYSLPINKYEYMYITDKIETNNITITDADNMYYKLREQGYIWLDIKPDNVGKYNNEMIILDDIDIYTEKDILKTGTYSILDYLLHYNIDIALKELNWLKQNNPNFNINRINEYFNNQSTTTLVLIEELKDKFKKQQEAYTYNQDNNQNVTFMLILMNKIKEQNEISLNNSTKNTK